jgi:hypothetical protein
MYFFPCFSMKGEINMSKKTELLERASLYHHTHIYVPDQKGYVAGFSHEPGAMTAYQGKWEPTVDCKGLYDLDTENAWLTVNQYNALVLNTKNMLIADIDFGDDRLIKYAGAEECDEVVENLGELHLLDDELRPNYDLYFADQSYRVYRTHSGCRVICTSICIPWDDKGWLADRFMRFLRSDPYYIKLCDVQKCYRARLTHKPWRDFNVSSHVCVLEWRYGKGAVVPELEEQLRLHDELTLPETESSALA